MNIYHITRTDEVLGSQYKAAVVIADSEENARALVQNEFNAYRNEVEFPADKDVNCLLIGVTVPPMPMGGMILLSSYQAGVLDE